MAVLFSVETNILSKFAYGDGETAAILNHS